MEFYRKSENLLTKTFSRKRLKQEFLSREFARNILLGQVREACYFLKISSKEAIFELIKSSENCRSPAGWGPNGWNPIYSYAKWKFHCCIPIEFFSDNHKNQIEPVDNKIFIYLLANIPLKWASDFLEYIENPNKELSKKEKTNLSISCIILHDQFPGLYYGLFSIIEDLLDKIGPQILYDSIELESLHLSMKMNQQIIQCIGSKLTSQEVFHKLWDNELILLDEKTCNVLQSLFQCAEPYPNKSVLFNADNILTLTNQIIVKKKKQLIDFLVDPCYSMILENEKTAYEWVNNYLSSFPTLKSLLPVLFYQSLYKNQIIFNSLLSNSDNLELSEANSVFKECLKRFQNDSELFAFLRNLTGITTKPMLNEVSIPYFIGASTNSFSINDLANFMKRNYFIIDDASSRIDFLFIIAERCLTLALNFIENEDLATYRFIEWLPLINDENLLNKVIDDLFSLIFLKKDGKWICSLQSAKAIVDVIINFRNDKEFLRAKEKIDFAIYNEQSLLDPCFYNDSWIIEQILRSREIEESLKYVSENNEAREVIIRAVTARKLKNGEQVSLEEIKDRYIFANDVYLSIGVESPDLHQKSSSKVANVVETLLSRRLVTNDPMILIDGETLKAVINSAANCGKGMSFDKYPLLKLFIDFENLSKKIEYKGWKLLDIIDQIISEDKRENLEEFLNISGDAAFDFIKLYGKNLGDNFKALIDEKWPILSILLETDENKRNDKIAAIKNNSVLINYFHERKAKEENIDINVNIKKAIHEKDWEELNDMFYQCDDEEKYKEVINPFINTLTLNELSEILPFSTYTSLSIIKNKELCINDTLRNLLEMHEFYEAQILAKDFDLLKNIDQIAKEVLKDSPNKVISLYKLYFPESTIELKKEEDPEITRIKSVANAETNKFMPYVNKNQENSNVFVHFLHEFSKHNTKVETKLMIFAIEKSCDIIKQMEANDIDSESHNSYIFKRMFNALSLMKARLISVDDFPQFESIFLKLDILSRFMKRCCFQRYGLTYSLNNFESKEFGMFLLSLSIKFDFPNLAFDVVNSYQLNTPEILNRSLYCFDIGHFDDGLEELKRMFVATKLHTLDSRSTFNILKQKILYRIPIDVDSYCQSPEEKEFSLVSVIRSIQESQGSYGLVANSPQMVALGKAMDIASLYHEKVEFYASFGMFDECFKAFRILGPTPHHFMKYIVTVSLDCMQWGTFWLRLSKNKKDSEFSNFESQFKDLMQYLKTKECYTTIFDIFHRINDEDSAINFCFQLFLEATSWETMKDALIKMRNETKKALVEDNTKVYSTTKLFELQHRVELQLGIIDLFVESKHPFSNELELVTSKQHTIKLGAELLLEWNIGLLNEVCDFDDIKTDDICQLAVEELSSKGNYTVALFIKKMKTLRGKEAKRYLPSICHAFKSRIATDAEYQEFLIVNFDDPEIRKICM